MPAIANSELILNSDGSVYHLNLRPTDIADTIIFVGDPERVPKISKYFDSIEIKKQNREFVTHTGTLKNKKITIIATGIGTDNIDIVLNELDALVNINLETRTVHSKLKSLNIIRIGTSGALQADIPIDSFVVSEYAVGLDGLLHFYEFIQDDDININKTVEDIASVQCYTAKASNKLLDLLADDIRKGITLTASGFYAPQGRKLRLSPKNPNFIDDLSAQIFAENKKITNFEMETSAIYGLGKMLGHHCISFNAILANRVLGQFSDKHEATVDNLIVKILNKIIEKL
jgi:uridine phosphorylase